ncbi:hypothetical protein [Bacteroides finegoldii]|nr:hypothetical protein [Bacteroides finegoldii]
MKKFSHPVLGHFIAEEFERAHLSIEAMRKEIHMGKPTYYKMISGEIYV